ncbi:MAG: tRNA uridine-5-carboxymethylaminomethyl(34) synthesis GTPase MnmE [Sphingomonadaceae bacterium]|nr:tRNA uridine-5-carboxymethylaminomethyl(34) synthesis GTPase MnmE [Sphingomonadaceae bacterium]
MTDTIFALSSGTPPAAIAIVRVSGPDADAALTALTDHPLPAPRHATLRTLTDPESAAPLDTALALRFPGPASATGEDMVELHLHGGRATVAAVQAALAHLPGLRAAEPGEFTRHAFENGRIDLSEAEGLADLLRAETEVQRRAALAMAEGGLSRRVEGWRHALLALSARAEAAIDFADEDDVEPWPENERLAALAALSGEMAETLAAPPAERLRDGVRVGIAGPPNAGKSTLLNALVAREAAIVSPIAGTTRDLIEAPVVLGGLPLLLIDMAGLRDETGDAIERIGIDRALKAIERCDLLLWLGSPGEAPEHSDLIGIAAKCDIHPPGPGDSRLCVAALTGEGMRELESGILARASALLPAGDALALNMRQRTLLASAQQGLDAAAATSDLLETAEHLRCCREEMDRLTGRAGTEAMLDALFAQFCIGK